MQRAVFWNINLAKETRRLNRIGQVLQNAFVVGLCEVNWSPAATAEQAAKWGFPHHLLSRGDGSHRFNLALLSKSPIIQVASAQPHEKPFFHGALCGALPEHGHLVVCVTHLTPGAPHLRLEEAKSLRHTLLPSALATAAASSNGKRRPPLLLLGDLNSLSPRDAAAHTKIGLAKRLSRTRSWSKFSVNERLDYSILTALTEQVLGGPEGDVGLIDLQAEPLGGEGDADDYYEEHGVTVPTERGGDKAHAAPMRLDYALGSSTLRSRCPSATARILSDTSDGEAGELSDHFPIEAWVCDDVLKGHGDSISKKTPTPPPPTTTAQQQRRPSRDRAKGSDAGGSSCGTKSEYATLIAASEVARCRGLSGLASSLHSHRNNGGSDGMASSLGRCAVVGSSGQLLSGAALGAEIDRFDVVIRLNAAPVKGHEERVGSFTSARFVNAPQSSAWARLVKHPTPEMRSTSLLPQPIRDDELLVLSGSVAAWRASGMTHRHNLSVTLLNRSYRKQCVVPKVFTAADRAAHTRTHHNALTPTFGLEAVVHALHSCDSVDVYGFGVPRAELLQSEREELAEAERRLRLPPEEDDVEEEGARSPFRYHYWEERTIDTAADHKDKPWTYRSHNFALERARLRHMACAGVLRLHS